MQEQKRQPALTSSLLFFPLLFHLLCSSKKPEDHTPVFRLGLTSAILSRPESLGRWLLSSSGFLAPATDGAWLTHDAEDLGVPTFGPKLL